MFTQTLPLRNFTEKDFIYFLRIWYFWALGIFSVRFTTLHSTCLEGHFEWNSSFLKIYNFAIGFARWVKKLRNSDKTFAQGLSKLHSTGAEEDMEIACWIEKRYINCNFLVFEGFFLKHGWNSFTCVVKAAFYVSYWILSKKKMLETESY